MLFNAFAFQGKSVRQSLQTIYNEMSTSEELSHPGYWGGIISVGGDTKIDIRNVRRKAQEKAISDGTGLIRSSVCLKELEHGFDGRLKVSKVLFEMIYEKKKVELFERYKKLTF